MDRDTFHPIVPIYQSQNTAAMYIYHIVYKNTHLYSKRIALDKEKQFSFYFFPSLIAHEIFTTILLYTTIIIYISIAFYCIVLKTAQNSKIVISFWYGTLVPTYNNKILKKILNTINIIYEVTNKKLTHF